MTMDILAEINSLTLEAQQTKSPSEAVELYEKAFDKSKQTKNDKVERTCALNLGAAHVWNNDPKAGLSALHKAKVPGGETDGYGHDADLSFNEANAYLKLGDREQAQKCFENAFELYERDGNGEMKKECARKLANVYCDIATKARLDPSQVSKAEDKADECLKLNLSEMGLQGEECTDASKVLNELGLVYTQLQKYDKAVQCFEKAVELCRQSGTTHNEQLMAVLLQNLGAGYNFLGDYQRSIKFHEDAEKKYTKTGVYRIGRNGQGQCYMNLAYAYCQLEGGASDNAFRAFLEAKKAALDTDDKHMLWQAYEGLGAIYFNQGNFHESAENYREAVQRIPDEESSKRVVEKLGMALQYKMSQQIGGNRGMTSYTPPSLSLVQTPQPGYIIPPVQTQQMQSRVVEKLEMALQYKMSQQIGGNRGMTSYTPPSRSLVQTPQPGYIIPPVQTQQMQSTLSETQERQIIPHREAQVMASGQNMMASVHGPVVAETKRGKIRMRKKDSIGPHFPKVAQGFGMLSTRTSVMSNPETNYMDTPRAKPTAGLDTDDITEGEESTDSNSDSSDSDSDDSDDTKIEPKQDKVASEKVEEIFRKPQASPNYMLATKHGTQEEASLKKYANMLSEKEAEEDQPDDTEEDSEESGDSTTDEEEEEEDEDETTPKRTALAPPLSAQAPPQNALNSADIGTYLNKGLQKSPDHYSSKINGHSHDSPRATTSDPDPPYATIGSLKRSGDEFSAGNTTDKDPSKPKQPKLHTEKSGTKHKSENFFESDDNTDEETILIKGGSPGYRSVKIEGDDGDDDNGRLENLPRGQREQFLHEEHLKRQQEEADKAPPPLPDRKEKSSKTCVIM